MPTIDAIHLDDVPIRTFLPVRPIRKCPASAICQAACQETWRPQTAGMKQGSGGRVLNLPLRFRQGFTAA